MQMAKLFLTQWAGWKVLGKLSELILKIVGTTGSSYNGDATVIMNGLDVILYQLPLQLR